MGADVAAEGADAPSAVNSEGETAGTETLAGGATAGDTDAMATGAIGPELSEDGGGLGIDAFAGGRVTPVSRFLRSAHCAASSAALSSSLLH